MTAEERWTTTNNDRVEIYRDILGDFRWSVRAANGEIVEQGESHPDKRDAVAAAERHHPRVGEES